MAIDYGNLPRETLIEMLEAMNETVTGDLVTEGIITTNTAWPVYFSPLETAPYIKVGRIVIAKFEIVGNPDASTSLAVADSLIFGTFNFPDKLVPVSDFYNLITAFAGSPASGAFSYIDIMRVIKQGNDLIVRPSTTQTAALLKTRSYYPTVLWFTN